MKRSVLLVAFFMAGCYGIDNLGPYYEFSEFSGDRYAPFDENPFVNVADEPVSTFSTDADGASYANVRRFLTESMLPPKAAIRIEEMINYFPLNYEDDNSDHPISLNGEVSQCPWTPGNKLIRIGIKGRTIPENELPPSNIVLLIDVSGSMTSDDKLPLLKKGFNLLVDEFTAQDRIAIVTYAGSAGVVLQSTPGDQKSKIKNAINSLGSGGSTAGAAGLVTAYEIAQANLIEGGNNRVILGTDGDFNVGIYDEDELVNLIESKRDLGIFFTAIGVGRGNLNDSMMEKISNHGNGTYEYIDNLEQAKKVFVYEFNKFYAVAKDVKVQVEFNPALVEAYRLIGYENRALENEDFEDDQKDAGEISAGQNVTALYEIKPHANVAAAAKLNPTFTLRFRYKEPDEDESHLLLLDVHDQNTSFSSASENMILTGSIAGFGMMLRDSQYKGDLTYSQLLTWSSQALQYDPHNYRKELRSLISLARAKSGKN